MCDLGSAVTEYVRAAIDKYDQYERALATATWRAQSEGWRIVDGGCNPDGSWVTKDWQTGAVLSQGTGGWDAYTADADQHGADWFHMDKLSNELEDADPELLLDPRLSQGSPLPDTLAAKLAEWVSENEEEARKWVNA